MKEHKEPESLRSQSENQCPTLNDDNLVSVKKFFFKGSKKKFSMQTRNETKMLIKCSSSSLYNRNEKDILLTP